MLAQFDHWVWLVRAQFVLGAQIIHRAPQLRRGVYHVGHAGRLLAVLDFLHGKAAIAPHAQSLDLWQAQWLKRPIGAHDLPESFTPATPAHLVRTYVRRTDRTTSVGPELDSLLRDDLHDVRHHERQTQTAPR